MDDAVGRAAKSEGKIARTIHPTRGSYLEPEIAKGGVPSENGPDRTLGHGGCRNPPIQGSRALIDPAARKEATQEKERGGPEPTLVTFPNAEDCPQPD